MGQNNNGQATLAFNVDEFEEWGKGFHGGRPARLPFSETVCVYIPKTKTGLIYFSVAAYELMGRPTYIKVLTAPGRLAFRVGSQTDGYKVLVSKAFGHGCIRVDRLVKNYRLTPKKSMVLYTATVDDRTIIVNLSQKPLDVDWEYSA